MKITIVGIGYVGLSNAVLLSQKHQVILYDIDQNKVDLVNQNKSTIFDKDISYYLKHKNLSLFGTTDAKTAFSDSDVILICTSTNFVEDKLSFDTTSIEETILKIKKYCLHHPEIIIKSTVPVGFTRELINRFNLNSVYFIPEFLREGKALFDCLHPSRLVVGTTKSDVKHIINLFIDGLEDKDVPTLVVSLDEAESIKLFSNTYLAMRVAFFNELDTFALIKGINTKNIIKGVSLDPRIGEYYHNPSFGYGGYCLPKDTKMLKQLFDLVPNNLIASIVDSNLTRKKFIVEMIIKYLNDKLLSFKQKPVVGFYRLNAKKDSDNMRNSVTLDIINLLIKENKDIKVIVYEPLINKGDDIFNYHIRVVNDLDKFLSESTLVVANRMSGELIKAKDKLFVRDIFNKD